MYAPYRSGYEFWLPVETVRILLLTSTVGFISKSCYMKLLMANLLSLVFLCTFLWLRPYRSGTHNMLQTLAMAVPVVGTGYALAGGWEVEKERFERLAGRSGLKEDTVEFDSNALFFVHVVLIGGPVLMNVFTLLSTIYVWLQARRERGKPGAAGKDEASSHGSQTKDNAKKEKRKKRHRKEKEYISKVITRAMDSFSHAERASNKGKRAALNELREALAEGVSTAVEMRRKRSKEVKTGDDHSDNSWLSWSSRSSLVKGSSSGSDDAASVGTGVALDELDELDKLDELDEHDPTSDDRAALIKFYERVAPSHIKNVDEILKKFKGEREKMWQLLEGMYPGKGAVAHV